MKKFAFLALALALAVPAFAQKFFTLDEPLAGAKTAIIEVLNYRCSHCFAHHRRGTLGALAAAAGQASARFVQPLSGGPLAPQIACAMAYAEAADAHALVQPSSAKSLSHRLLSEIFAAQFVHKNQANLPQILPQILNIAPKALEQFCASDAAANALAAAKSADLIMKKYGTPAFVINNKYLINISEINSLKELEEVTKELLKQ